MLGILDRWSNGTTVIDAKNLINRIARQDVVMAYTLGCEVRVVKSEAYALTENDVEIWRKTSCDKQPNTKVDEITTAQVMETILTYEGREPKPPGTVFELPFLDVMERAFLLNAQGFFYRGKPKTRIDIRIDKLKHEKWTERG